MNHSRKHHFIPAFYLKNWTSTNGKILEWSKPNGKVKSISRHPNATGFQLDLYTLSGLSPASKQILEDKYFRGIDDLASRAIKLLIEGSPLLHDNKVRSGWSAFLMTLRFRHPDSMPELREAVRRVWHKHDPISEEKYQALRQPSDPTTLEQYQDKSLTPEMKSEVDLRLLQTIMNNPKIGQTLHEMHWKVLDVSSASFRLLTSDWPIELRLGVPEPNVSLPISPTQLFVATKDHLVMRTLQYSNPDKLVKAINLAVTSKARRYVFSSDAQQSQFIKKNMSSAIAPLPLYPEISNL